MDVIVEIPEQASLWRTRTLSTVEVKLPIKANFSRAKFFRWTLCVFSLSGMFWFFILYVVQILLDFGMLINYKKPIMIFYFIVGNLGLVSSLMLFSISKSEIKHQGPALRIDQRGITYYAKNCFIPWSAVVAARPWTSKSGYEGVVLTLTKEGMRDVLRIEPRHVRPIIRSATSREFLISLKRLDVSAWMLVHTIVALVVRNGGEAS